MMTTRDDGIERDRQALERWRLVLGPASQLGLGNPDFGGEPMAMDQALEWLYDREADLADRDVRPGRAVGEGDQTAGEKSAGSGPAETLARGKKGGSGPSVLTVPEWINEVHRLFPKETIERLEKDAVERYEILEIVTNREVLQRVEPNTTLLQAILRTKHLMNQEVLELARQLAARVVRDLMEKLNKEVRASFSGTRDPRRPSPYKTARNLDYRRTVRKNLAHYSQEEKRLYIHKPLFSSRVRRHSSRWQIIILVDQSGSMLGSVIHSSIIAACLWGLPAVKTHLCVFDTEVVDLTKDVTDPVELLMKLQLGGGTDIGKAVTYASGLIDNPRRTIVVLITDFFEGGEQSILIRRVKSLCEQGTEVLGLGALEPDATPNYDRGLAGRLVEVGSHVGAMTPGELANWIAEKVAT